MDLTINGEAAKFAQAMSVEELIAALELDPRKVAVELNLEIVPKSLFGATRVCDGDRLEIVHFVGGG